MTFPFMHMGGGCLKDREGTTEPLWGWVDRHPPQAGQGRRPAAEHLGGPGSSLTSVAHRFWAVLSQAGWDQGLKWEEESVAPPSAVPGGGLESTPPPTTPTLQARGPRRGASS